MPLVQIKRRAEGVKYENEAFQNLDLRSMKAFGAEFTSCLFTDCKFDLSDMRTVKLKDCSFHRCDFRLVNFGASILEDCAFVSCDMEQASFMGCQFRKTLFSNCRLAYGDVMFQDVTVKERLEFSECNLHGSSLDFREVEPGSLKFQDCNLWGAKMAMGCAFWNGEFDERAIKQFLALVARVSQDLHLRELAGEQFGIVARAMDGRKHMTTPILAGMEG